MKNKFEKQGFMMIEIVVATAIILVVVLASMSVATKTISFSHQSMRTTQASFLLEEGAEAVRIVRDNTWNNISSLIAHTAYYPTFSGGTWILSTTPNQVGIFTRVVAIADVTRDATTGDISASGVNDPGTKLVTVTVSWPEGGQTITKSLAFYILDIFS